MKGWRGAYSKDPVDVDLTQKLLGGGRHDAVDIPAPWAALCTDKPQAVTELGYLTIVMAHLGRGAL